MKLQDLFVPRRKISAGSPLAAARIEPGLYHYVRDAAGTPARFHLRVDSTDTGLLVANAAAVAKLRASGVIIAKAVLEGQPDPSIVGRLTTVFRGVTADQARRDVERVRDVISKLESPKDSYPILNMADPAFSSVDVPLERPLSADVPLAEPERIVPLLDRLWELAIPHVTFVAGEGCNPQWLIRAVERTEDLGLIAGVRIRGTDLLQGTLLADLATAGVDHVDVLYLSRDPSVHDALAGAGDHGAAVRALSEIQRCEICAVAEVALVETTLHAIEETIESLVARDVINAAVFAVAAPEREKAEGPLSGGALVQAAMLVEESAEQHGVRLIWYPPLRFDPRLPLAQQVRRGPRSSGDSAIRLEPDGTVIPGRGPWQPAGNLMAGDWDSIRNEPSYQAYRRRVETDTHCDTCPGLAICAADCPRHPEGWADDRGKD
ncbi:MAG: radical SAM protein [Pirellulales bacterium]|nr:radical SAM protein [Pirellulales bacterium]